MLRAYRDPVRVEGGGNGEQPFPLQRRFRQYILPLLLVAVAVLSGLVTWTTLRLTSDLYLQAARQYAQMVVDRVQAEAPEAWTTLITHDSRTSVVDAAAVARVRAVLLAFLGEERLSRLRLFDRRGRILFSHNPEDIGTFEANDILRHVTVTAQPQVSFAGDSGDEDGLANVYDSYVAITGTDGKTLVVMELFESADYVDPLLIRATALAAIPPAVLLLGLVVLLSRMVAQAQREIDTRTGALAALKGRLETLVSSHALGAVETAADGAVLSRVMDATLLYSDVVDFTGYSESQPPQEVVNFLNDLMTVQVEDIQRFGGDVDKMIGDAVLGVFEGTDRAERAIACAQSILRTLAGRTDLPRTIRIGIHDGYVIAGAIGPIQRRDFTVIGDSVNVTARLCGLGESGELVTDSATVARAGHPAGFSAAEELMVKGRSEPVRVRRWRMMPAAAQPEGWPVAPPEGRGLAGEDPQPSPKTSIIE